MQQFSLSEKKSIENLAVNTPVLKDYGEDGFNSITRQLKEGFYQLKDCRVINLDELFSGDSSTKEKGFDLDLMNSAEKHKDSLSDLKNIAYRNGQLKNGFFVCSDGKVISIKQLKNLITKDTDVTDPKTVTTD